LWFLPFILFAVVGLYYSPVLNTAFQKTISYFLLLLVVPNYVAKIYVENGVTFLRRIIFFLVFVCLVGLAFTAVNSEISISHGGRFRGIFGNPNGLGIFLVITAMLFTVINNRYKELFSRRETVYIYIIIFFLIVITGSRTALLSFVLFFLFSMLFRINTMLGLAAFVILIFLTEYIVKNFVLVVQSVGLESELRIETLQEGSGRLIAWDFAWKEIQRGLLIGRGMGYDEYYMRLNFDVLSKLGHEGGVHNTYLILWLNTGLSGLISFFVAFFALFIKASFRDRLSFPAMITVMFSIIFEPWLAASLNPYTILLLILITLLTQDIFYQDISGKAITDTDA
jgi:O-antigen ligase